MKFLCHLIFIKSEKFINEGNLEALKLMAMKSVSIAVSVIAIKK